MPFPHESTHPDAEDGCDFLKFDNRVVIKTLAFAGFAVLIRYRSQVYIPSFRPWLAVWLQARGRLRIGTVCTLSVESTCHSAKADV